MAPYGFESKLNMFRLKGKGVI